MNLLLITDENKSHYVYLKDFNIVMCNKKNQKKKRIFFTIFSSEKDLQ